MKKFFKEINLLKLMGIVLGVIEYGLMTTFLILCRGWINDSAGLYVYVVICIFNIVISGGIIYMIGLLIWELIENKKENKRSYKKYWGFGKKTRKLNKNNKLNHLLKWFFYL